MAGIGIVDGTGSSATFNNPGAIAVDKNGNVFISDGVHMTRKITPLGAVSTVAGSLKPSYTAGVGTSAGFNAPAGIELSTDGSLYVADSSNNCIRKIDSVGVVTTLVGTSSKGSVDGIGTAARFQAPSDVAFDSAGNIMYVLDKGNNIVRRVVVATAAVSFFAGSMATATGFADGIGSAASFNAPAGIAVKATGDVIVADTANNRIRMITSSAVVTTIAGSSSAAFADGIGTNALFSSPQRMALDLNANIYVADFYNNRIRMISPAYVVTTVVGVNQKYADGVGTAINFNSFSGVAIDSSGNFYVAETYTGVVRKVSVVGTTVTSITLAGRGSADGTGSNAVFMGPWGVDLDSSGSIYFTENYGITVRKIASGTSQVVTYAGSLGHNVNWIDGAASSARYYMS